MLWRFSQHLRPVEDSRSTLGFSLSFCLLFFVLFGFDQDLVTLRHYKRSTVVFLFMTTVRLDFTIGFLSVPSRRRQPQSASHFNLQEPREKKERKKETNKQSKKESNKKTETKKEKEKKKSPRKREPDE